MKLLGIYYTHKPGGFCKRLYRLFNALATREHEVHYLTLDSPPSSFPNSTTVHLIPFPLSSRSGITFWILFMLWTPIYTAYKARKITPDRYIVFSPIYSALLLLTRLTWRKPIALFLRALVFRINRITKKPLLVAALSNTVERLGIRIADSVICMSNSMKQELEEFLGHSLSNTAILPNEVPTMKIEKKNLDPQTRINILSSGVLDQRKNISFLLQALSQVLKKQTTKNIHLSIAGKGPLLSKLQKEAEELGIHREVSFLGWQEDMTVLYSQTDLYIQPTLHEGAPNSVLEALGAGIPVLCSDIPEMRELIANDLLLFTLENPKQLADSIDNFSMAGDASLQVSQASQAVREKLSFDWDEKACKIALNIGL